MLSRCSFRPGLVATPVNEDEPEPLDHALQRISQAAGRMRIMLAMKRHDLTLDSAPCFE